MVIKSYNPFKMWGSYVGVIINLFIPMPFIFGGFIQPIELIGAIPSVLISGDLASNAIGMGYLTLILLPGFLIGWGIHSLIRRFTK